MPDIILPKFSLTANELGNNCVIAINNASIGYKSDSLFLQEINLSINAKERVAILGNNGSGKSTLIKAILEDTSVFKTGTWHLPKPQDVGYLDQHYSNLNSKISVYDTISTATPEWLLTEVRKHLNDFLFRRMRK